MTKYIFLFYELKFCFVGFFLVFLGGFLRKKQNLFIGWSMLLLPDWNKTATKFWKTDSEDTFILKSVTISPVTVVFSVK